MGLPVGDAFRFVLLFEVRYLELGRQGYLLRLFPFMT
jgi:hypothetical protein